MRPYMSRVGAVEARFTLPALILGLEFHLGSEPGASAVGGRRDAWRCREGAAGAVAWEEAAATADVGGSSTRTKCTRNRVDVQRSWDSTSGRLPVFRSENSTIARLPKAPSPTSSGLGTVGYDESVDTGDGGVGRGHGGGGLMATMPLLPPHSSCVMNRG